MCDPVYMSTIKDTVNAGQISDEGMKRLAGRAFHMGLVGSMLTYVLSTILRVPMSDPARHLNFVSDGCDEEDV